MSLPAARLSISVSIGKDGHIMRTTTAGSVLAPRWVLVPFVLLLVLAQGIFLVKPAEALNDVLTRPGSAAGKSTFGPHVWRGASRVLGPVGIGLLAWEGYKFYVDYTSLDITTARVGGCLTPLSGTPEAQYFGAVCWNVLGIQSGKWAVEVSAEVREVHPDATKIRIRPVGHVFGYSQCMAATWQIEQPLSGAGTYTSVWQPDTNRCPLDQPVQLHAVAVTQLNASGTVVASYTASYSEDDYDRAPDAFYTVTTRIDCYDPATGTTQSVLVDQEVFVSEDGGFQSAPAQCPEGTIMSGVEVGAGPSTGTIGPDLDLYTWEQDQGLLVPAPHPYADCLDGSCELRVERVVDLTVQDPEWEACSWQLENCVAWWWESNKQDLYRCMWGSYVLDLSECTELAYYYHPTYPGRITPNPSLIPPATPSTEPITQDSSIPWAPPNTPPVTTEPPPGTPDNPVTITNPPVETPGSEDGCLATGLVAWNPVTWVYAPVKCALQWAFVPSAATIGLITSTGDAFMGKAPFSFWEDASGWLAPLQGGGSQCLLIQGTVVGHPLTVVDSCTPGPVEAHIMSWRPWLLIVVHAWVMVPLMWWAWKAYMPGSQGVA